MREIIGGRTRGLPGKTGPSDLEYSWIQHAEKDGGQNSYSTAVFFGEFGYTAGGRMDRPMRVYEYTHFE